MRACVAIAGLAACTPSAAPRSQPAPATQPRSACPAAFDFAHDGTSCRGDELCGYPEGSCRCVRAAACSLVGDPDVLPDEPEPVGREWRCRGPSPLYARPDGCPGEPPPRNGACTSDGQICRYGGACAGHRTTASCVDSRWQVDARDIDPPA